MKLPRRSFLKSSLAASAAAATLASRSAAAPAAGAREYYEVRCYRLKPEKRLKSAPNRALLDTYLEKALLPALARRKIGPVGVFTELEVNKAAATATPLADSPVWVLIPHPNLESIVAVNADLNLDPAVQQAGTAYLATPKAAPAYERIDSWVLRAFKSMPKMEIPDFSAKRVPTRVFEMRDYESHSEERALNKMAMFDDGETDIMRTLGMAPLFFGQAVAGPNLPHLRYFTGGPDLATHLANWKKFGPDPRWNKLKVDPRFADNTSLNTARFLAPTAYSQI